MKEQQGLFDRPQGDAFARRKDPDTAHEAAASIRGAEATRLEAIVLERLKSYPDTTEGLVHRTGLSLVSISPRIAPLVRKGLVCDSGERRRGASGRNQIVWKAL